MGRLPNAISASRALSTIAVVALLAPATGGLALLVFAVAALTDAVDGPLARRLRATSALGAFLDPVADKILVLGALGGLLAHADVDPLPVGLILAREIVVTGVRAIAAGRGTIVTSSIYGKAKAVLQGAAVVGQMIVLTWPALALDAAADTLLWGATVVTLATGPEVMRRAVAALGSPSGAVRAHAH